MNVWRRDLTKHWMYQLLFWILFGFNSSASADVILNGEPEELARYLSQLHKEVVLSGEGEAYSLVEHAEVRLSVVTENKTISQALHQNKTIRNKLMLQLDSMGISAGRVSVAKFSSTPKYGFFGDTPKSYQVLNRLSVDVMSEDELIQIAELSDTYPEVFYAETTPASNHLSGELEQQALAIALANVLKKKQQYEQTLGLTLYPVEFEEQQNRVMPVNMPPKDSIDGLSLSESTIRMQHEPEESKVTAYIKVTFRVVDDDASVPKRLKKTSL